MALRVSAISFLNTAPLMWNFEHGETAQQLSENFTFTYTVPSQCAEELKADLADIGIIPAAAYTTIPGLTIIPDIAIASKNSAALVEIFLRKFVGVDPGFRRQKAVLDEMLRWHDAALLIGDPALQAGTEGYYVYDLAEQWRRWTGRPFVFAFWAVRKAALNSVSTEVNLPQIFQQSRDAGLKHIPEIVKEWSPRLELPEAVVSSYLKENIDYGLDAENLEGLRLFYKYAAEMKVLPEAPELDFLEHKVASRS